VLRGADDPVDASAVTVTPAITMLAGTSVVEIGTSEITAFCGRLLAGAGATVIVVESGSDRRLDPAAREFLHAGKRSLRIGGDGASLLAAIERRATVVLRPREPAVAWRAALEGTALAVETVAALLGGALDLAARGPFPLPGPGPRPAGGPSPLLRAADGWVVTGPSKLPADTLERLLGDGVASWVADRPRAEAADTLQQLRMLCSPVLEPGEACRAAGRRAALRRAPRPGEHTRALLGDWLGLSTDDVERVISEGVALCA
jgi:hypothetical protein